MFTVDIRVNDSGPVAVLYVHNTGYSLGDLSVYEYERHDIGGITGGNSECVNGQVTYDKREGIWSLVRACIEDFEGPALCACACEHSDQ